RAAELCPTPDLPQSHADRAEPQRGAVAVVLCSPHGAQRNAGTKPRISLRSIRATLLIAWARPPARPLTPLPMSDLSSEGPVPPESFPARRQHLNLIGRSRHSIYS